jgi:hypothetical protein
MAEKKRRTDERSNLDVVFVHCGHYVSIERKLCGKKKIYEVDIRFIYIYVKMI